MACFDDDRWAKTVDDFADGYDIRMDTDIMVPLLCFDLAKVIILALQEIHVQHK